MFFFFFLKPAVLFGAQSDEFNASVEILVLKK